MMQILWLLCLVPSVFSLDNGLALTPPMGWLTWQRYECTTDCEKYPDDCISENLMKRMADLMASDGYLKAGYEYLGIDDCWLEMKRGSDGALVPDRKRFPSGMKALADYIHSKGLKFGIYQDYGNTTCQGYPGLMGYEEIDVNTFVQWDVDYLKLDGCAATHSDYATGYPLVGKLLNESSRPIVYSCSWPAYLDDNETNYTLIAEHCNLWRNYGDIDDSWHSVRVIMDWFGDRKELADFAGPGSWNDPDMLIIGNFGLSKDQARVQMAVWAVLAAPLMMSVDLATIKPEFKEILLNEDIIAVNQDKLGKQGSRTSLLKDRKLEVWSRQVTDGYAVAFVSRRTSGPPYVYSFSFNDTGLPEGDYLVKDLYKEEKDRQLSKGDAIEVRINPSGVKFYKFFLKSSNDIESTQL